MGETRRPKTMAHGHPDDFQTPPAALEPLLPYLRRAWRIWEPACGRGNLVRGLRQHGFEVVASDVRDDVPGDYEARRDFRLWSPERFDAIVTNPPFSIKDEFLGRCYALERPFALLLPLTTFEGRKRQDMFRRHGVEVILLPGRVHFETPNGKGSSPYFMTAWFTHGLHIGRALTFWTPTAQPSLLEGAL